MATATPIRRRGWDQSTGTYLVGRAVLDGVDALAIEMERKWGCGRLRLLVSNDLRERFDRQRYKLNYAILKGELIDIQTEGQRMINAWTALDRAAEAAGAKILDPEVWEAATEDGFVLALVRDPAAAGKVVVEQAGSERPVTVYTLDEVARILAQQAAVVAIKRQWPGATVTYVRSNVSDPLDGVDASRDLNDPVEDLFPPTGI